MQLYNQEGPGVAFDSSKQAKNGGRIVLRH